MDDAAAFVIADGAIVRIERGNGAQRVLVDADAAKSPPSSSGGRSAKTSGCWSVPA
jgi:hypothetical protein